MPSVAESGAPGYEYELWWGIFAPSKTPKPVLDRLNAEINKALAAPQPETGTEPHQKITSLADRVRALQKAASAG